VCKGFVQHGSTPAVLILPWGFLGFGFSGGEGIVTVRVLYLLNISNPDRLAADSGWIFADLLVPALADAGAEVTVAAPAPVRDARCGFECTAVPGTKYRVRFAADLDQLTALIRRSRP
jgi:hypothetical protein